MSKKPSQRSKSDSALLVAIVTTIGAIVVALISSVVGPWAQRTYTSTATPASTPDESVLASISDQINPSILGEFVKRWAHTNYSLQYFEGGVMLWGLDENEISSIWVLYNAVQNKQESSDWAKYKDTWTSSEPAPNCPKIDPEKGPFMGFGKVWCDNSTIQTSLGNAQEKEDANNDATIEFYENGLLFSIPQDKRVWVVLNSGKWYRYDVKPNL